MQERGYWGRRAGSDFLPSCAGRIDGKDVQRTSRSFSQAFHSRHALLSCPLRENDRAPHSSDASDGSSWHQGPRRWCSLARDWRHLFCRLVTCEGSVSLRLQQPVIASPTCLNVFEGLDVMDERSSCGFVFGARSRMGGCHPARLGGARGWVARRGWDELELRQR